MIYSWSRRALLGIAGSIVLVCTSSLHAQETSCAKVKIEIKQELTLERQAFDAAMMFTTSNTGDETLRLCEMKVIAERKIDANQSEFTVTGRLSNLGSALKGAVATPLPVLAGQMLNAGVTAASGVLTFGAINSMETGSTPATVTVRARPGNAGIVAIMLKGLKWSVQVTR